MRGEGRGMRERILVLVQYFIRSRFGSRKSSTLNARYSREVMSHDAPNRQQQSTQTEKIKKV